MHQTPQEGFESVRDNPITSVPSIADGGHVSPVATPALRPMKGRKRFTADLGELNAHPELLAHSGQWSVQSMFPSFSVRLSLADLNILPGVEPGDEEASLEVVLANAEERKTQMIILVVSGKCSMRSPCMKLV